MNVGAEGSHLGLRMMYSRDFSEFLSVKSNSSDDVRDDNFKWNDHYTLTINT